MPSSVRPSRDSSLRIRIAPDDVTLRDWPLRDRPLGSLAAIGLAAAVNILAGWAADSPLVGGGVALAMAVILWKTWLPVWYELSRSGVSQIVLRWRRRIPWTAIRRHEIRTNGVLLVPDPVLTPLSPLRGLLLPWGRKKPEVLAHIDYYLQTWNAGSSPGTARTPRP